MRTELHAQQTPAMPAVMGELSRAIEDGTRAVAGPAPSSGDSLTWEGRWHEVVKTQLCAFIYQRRERKGRQNLSLSASEELAGDRGGELRVGGEGAGGGASEGRKGPPGRGKGSDTPEKETTRAWLGPGSDAASILVTLVLKHHARLKPLWGFLRREAVKNHSCRPARPGPGTLLMHRNLSFLGTQVSSERTRLQALPPASGSPSFCEHDMIPQSHPARPVPSWLLNVPTLQFPSTSLDSFQSL